MTSNPNVRQGDYWRTVVWGDLENETGSDYAAYHDAVTDFHALGNMIVLEGVTPIICTRGVLSRQKSENVFRYRNIIAIVRRDGNGDTRGTIVLLAILERDRTTYDPARLERLIGRVSKAAKRGRIFA